MRTIHCSSRLLGGGGGGVCLGGFCPGGVCLGGGMSAQGVCLPRVAVCLVGVCPVECLPGGGVWPGDVQQTLPLWTEWQTPVKTLTCRNYVADGKNYSSLTHKSNNQNLTAQLLVSCK